MQTRITATRSRRFGRKPLFAALLATAVLAACGGGGDSSASSGSSGSGGGTTGLTLSGTVATGAAVTNATVRYTCANGGGTIAAHAATGAYSASGLTVTLPCVLEATGNSGTTTVTLHSVAEGSGSNVTANITPLTELLVAELTGQDPAAYYSGVASGSISSSVLTATVTGAGVGSAAQAVVNLLAAAGVDTSSVANAQDIVSASFTAASGSTAGNGQDAALDALARTITSTGSSLGTLVTAVAAASSASDAGGSATASGSDTVTASMLPADLLLKPKAATCDALRGGKYQFIGALPGFTASLIAGGGAIGMLDVSAMSFTWDDNTTSGTLVPVNGQSCRYTITEGAHTAELVVAPSGVIVARTQNIEYNGNYRLAVALPVQTIAVSELAGDWNGLVWDTDGTSFGHTSVGATITGSGTMTISCAGDASLTAASCSGVRDTATIAAHGAGGVTLQWSDGSSSWTTRAFAFKAGNGHTVIVNVNGEGGIAFFTKARTLTSPTVGDTHKAWNIQTNAAAMAADPVAYNRFDITAAGDGTFTRTVTNLGTGVGHPQTLSLNSARNGWIHRAAGTATGSDGSTVTIRAMYALKLGIGISAYYLPPNNGQSGTAANARLGLSVTQP